MPRMRCFGTMQAMHGDEVLSHGLRAATGIDVAEAEGWIYVETDGGKPRPGWVSTIPGSELQMAIDTDFGEQDGPHFITLFFLSSYEHMGQAEVTCISGCKCDASIIDGHVPDHRHSIPKQHDFMLSRHHPGSGSGGNSSTSAGDSRCIVKVKVLQESRSGEHKVKVMQLAVKTWVNVTAALPHAIH